LSKQNLPSNFFILESIPGETLYCAKQYTVVLEEGPPKHFFGASNPVENSEAEAVAGEDAAGEDLAQKPIDQSIFHLGNCNKDIALVCAQGLEVHDDNEPAPENVPEEEEAAGGGSTSGLVDEHGQKWGWDGIDERKLKCPLNPEPGFTNSWSPLRKTSLEIFMLLFPMKG